MIVRNHLDIGWHDLLFAATAALRPFDRSTVERRLELHWSPSGDAIACLSVRSGFDALLSALELPLGSQVLVSAITIPHMVEILDAHGLVPVPVDLDVERLAVDAEDLDAAVTPATRAVLVAHLFGSRMPMGPLIDVARRHGLIVIEDCAQSYTGPDDTGADDVDVSMFSFGIIKTATALGGALLRVKDPETRARLRATRDAYPVQSRLSFLARVAKVACLKAVSGPTAFGALAWATRMIGRDLDTIVLRATRGVTSSDLPASIRRRPTAAQLSLLDRRLRRFDPASIARRRSLAERFAAKLPPQVERPGTAAEGHSYWLFPVMCDDPDALVIRLADAGFDATRGGSALIAVRARPTGSGRDPSRAEDMLARVVYVPVHRRLPARARAELAELVAGSARVPRTEAGHR